MQTSTAPAASFATVKKRVAELRPADYNPRTISDEELGELEKSMAEFGYLEPIVWNERSGCVVGGHQRLKILKRQGVEEIDVVRVDLPPAKERTLNIALNGIRGSFDEALLADVLSELGVEDRALAGVTEVEFDEILDRVKASLEPKVQGDPEAIPTDVQRRTRPGDLWLLGKHRLLCGDATVEEDVERLLMQDCPDLMVTDPPYGVDYDPAWRKRAAEAGSISFSPKRLGTFKGDKSCDWTAAWFLFPGSIAYIWHASMKLGELLNSLVSAGFFPRAHIIWRKSSPVISRGAYNWQHESCLYAVRKGKKAGWIGPKNETTVWEIHSVNAVPTEQATDHSSQKPLEAMERPIRNHRADAVFDPFVGSGTTIIAAERMKRRCLALEIDPYYCDVAVRRWEEFTGKSAALYSRLDEPGEPKDGVDEVPEAE